MTRIRYQRADHDSDCSDQPVNKDLLKTQDGGGDEVTLTSSQGDMDEFYGKFITEDGDPGSFDPDSFLYRGQLDVVSAGSNLEYHIFFQSYLDVDCEQQNQKIQDESDFTGTGLKLGSTNHNVNNSYRWGFVVRITHTGAHGAADEDLVLRTNNSDAWYEFPGEDVADTVNPELLISPSQLIARPIVVVPYDLGRGCGCQAKAA